MTTATMNGTKRAAPKMAPKIENVMGSVANATPGAKKPSRFGAAKNTGQIIIPKIEIKVIRIRLVGDSPLVVHAWSHKAEDIILNKQMKVAVAAKEAKDPFQDYCDSMYWMTAKPEKPKASDVAKARFGFPVIGFKGAAVDACSFVDGMTKVMARGAFHINGELAEIKTAEPPLMRRDMVRIAMGTADVRHRGEFQDWSTELSIRYNSRAISPEQIVNLFNVAGFSIGVGEHRPARDGQWGMFHAE